MSRHRVARYGDGWSPFPAPRILVQHRQDAGPSRPSTTSARCSTSSGSSWRRRAATPPASTSSFGTGAGGSPGSDTFNPEAHLAAAEELAALGVTWSGAGVPGDSLAHALEALERFG